MPFFAIEDFKAGLDLRKGPLTAPAGTARVLVNCHVTQGAEIAKRHAFVHRGVLPPGSIGLVSVNGHAYTYVPNGVSSEPGSVAHVGVIGIVPPEGVTLAKLVSWDVFQAKPYAVIQDTDGHYRHYFGETIVSNWTTSTTAIGSFVRTYKTKMYALSGRILNFSAINDPTLWHDPEPDLEGNVAHNGSGFIDVGANDADSQKLISMEVYYSYMAIFSKLSCQIWFLDPAPANDQYYQTLRDAGTLAPRATRQFIANDLYYLGTHGIRSLRARDLSLTAAVADVGSPIDGYVQKLGVGKDASYLGDMKAILNPRSGRFWMILEDQILVLSNYPTPNILAWSVYIPEFKVKEAVYADPFMFFVDDQLNYYTYGDSDEVYDSCPITIVTPFLSFDRPAQMKLYQGIDLISTGVWKVSACFDPTLHEAPVYDEIGTYDGPTLLGGRNPMGGSSTHVQLKLEHAAPGPATLGKLFIHYAPSTAD